ncbi:PH domain-containing protein DDB_G0287875-like [Linepithema humile]|uniref:PH domain-containing protein DDB_G0287875-like n=1 Tax=Linepithema humile TaxID=83485 RepID=UPI00351EB58F
MYTQTNVCIEHDERGCEISAEQECTIGNNIASDREIIEVWNRTRGAKIKKLASNIAECQPIKQNKGQLVKQTRRLSFESWKKEKNLKYRKLLREAEEKKQRELREKVKDIEYKKASQDACAQMIREKEAQQRELSARLQAIRQTNMEILQKHIDERRVINARAFDDWKRQKNIKLREAKLMTM